MKREYHPEGDTFRGMMDPTKRMKFEGYPLPAMAPPPPRLQSFTNTYTPPQMAQPIPNPHIFQDLTIQSRVEIPVSLRSASLRKGKWTGEEEVYAHRIICDFEDGLLDIPARTHLRTYLAAMLHCDQMRISKKFKGNDKVGKQIFAPIKNASEPENQARILQARHTRQALQQAWYVKLNDAEKASVVPDFLRPTVEPNFDYLSHWRDRAQYALCYSTDRYEILSLMYEGRKIIDVLRHVSTVTMMNRGAPEDSAEYQACMTLYNDLVAKENLLRYNEMNFMGNYAPYEAENTPTSSAAPPYSLPSSGSLTAERPAYLPATAHPPFAPGTSPFAHAPQVSRAPASLSYSQIQSSYQSSAGPLGPSHPSLPQNLISSLPQDPTKEQEPPVQERCEADAQLSQTSSNTQTYNSNAPPLSSSRISSTSQDFYATPSLPQAPVSQAPATAHAVTVPASSQNQSSSHFDASITSNNALEFSKVTTGSTADTRNAAEEPAIDSPPLSPPTTSASSSSATSTVSQVTSSAAPHVTVIKSEPTSAFADALQSQPAMSSSHLSLPNNASNSPSYQRGLPLVNEMRQPMAPSFMNNAATYFQRAPLSPAYFDPQKMRYANAAISMPMNQFAAQDNSYVAMQSMFQQPLNVGKLPPHYGQHVPQPQPPSSLGMTKAPPYDMHIQNTLSTNNPTAFFNAHSSRGY